MRALGSLRGGLFKSLLRMAAGNQTGVAQSPQRRVVRLGRGNQFLGVPGKLLSGQAEQQSRQFLRGPQRLPVLSVDFGQGFQ